MQFMYKGEALNEPGNVDFGNSDISGIGDGTVTGAIHDVNRTKLSNQQFDWRAYYNITDALTANRSMFVKDKIYTISAVTNGGVPHVLVLHKLDSFIGGLLITYSYKPQNIITTNNGETWEIIGG